MNLAVVAASLTVLLSMAPWVSNAARAAEGDRLSISRQNVNIRTGPSTNAEVLLTINAGEEMIEIAEKGEWFFVDFPRHNKQGWIFGPLLDAPGTVPATPAAPAAVETPVTAAVEQPTPAAVPIAATPEPVETSPQIAEVTSSQPAALEPVTPAAVEQPASVEAPKQLTEVAPGEEPAAVQSFRETVVELNERAVSVAGINLFTDVRSTGGGGVQVLATETWTSVPEAGQSSYMNALFERWQSMANGLGPLTLQILDPAGSVVMQRSDS